MRPIAISLSPNTEKDDIILAIKTLLTPWKWFKEEDVKKLERDFESTFGENYKAIAINSGRSGEYLILKSLGIKNDDFVAIQAFTCVAVPNSVIWLGASPLYIDIDKTYNMNPNDLSEKLNEKVKAIIVQHTFGIPSDFETINKVAQSNKIPIIEDAAVSLGAYYKGKKIGTLGKIAFFSFGRDKVISSVFGGMILTSDKGLYKKIKIMRDSLGYPSKSWVFQQLFHPIAFCLILPLYNFGIGKFSLGKLILWVLQKMKILSKPVYEVEKKGGKPEIFPKRMPGALAILARKQLEKLERYNKKRKGIASFYRSSLGNDKYGFSIPAENEGAIWLRFPLLHPYAKEIFKFAKSKGILLGDWYKKVIIPCDNSLIVGYKEGDCKVAEKYSKKILNLPTYPTMTLKDAEKVVDILKLWKA